ncbi:2713_t:CDS:2 [Rhizophagus irregularis]|nr:2713_t:CDS:2 [Rhizophagus irregularis]
MSSNKRKSSKYIVDSDEEAGFEEEEQQVDDDEEEEEFEEVDEPKASKKGSSRSSKKIKKDDSDSDRSDRGENSAGETYFKLSNKKRVTIREWKNMVLIDFREFFETKDGKTQPTKKVAGIKFDLVATPSNAITPKCVSQYVSNGTLVVVTVKAGIGYNQRVDAEITDNSSSHNEYGRKRDIDGESRFRPDPKYHRTIDLDIDVGAEAIDYNALAQAEKLKPMEAELRKLEQVVQEIVDEMEYLRRREARMRDTNESTNERVKWFSLGSMFVLVGLGAWQIFYLKKFFQKKRLID